MDTTSPPILSGSNAVDTARSIGVTTRFFHTICTTDDGCGGLLGLGWRVGNRREGGKTSFDAAGEDGSYCGEGGVFALICSKGCRRRLVAGGE